MSAEDLSIQQQKVQKLLELRRTSIDNENKRHQRALAKIDRLFYNKHNKIKK